MKIAIVNNGENFPEKISQMVSEYPHEIFNLENVASLDYQRFDLIILSGSSQLPIEYNKKILEAEISLIQKSSTPILGICYGCELIAVAFGSKLFDRGAGSQERKPIPIRVLQKSPLFSEKKDFLVYDAHRWIIKNVPKEFDILAESDHGPEIIKHRTRPLYGFQFHPEKMPAETDGYELFHKLLEILTLGT